MPSLAKPAYRRERMARKHQAEKALKVAQDVVWTRDDYRCRICGNHVSKAGWVMDRGHVHHVVKRSQSKALRADPKNLILVCAADHQDLHAGRIFVSFRGSRLVVMR